MPMPSHEPEDHIRRTVEAMAAGGISQDEIARVLEIDPKTLRKHYRDELDTAATKANAKVAQTLYQKAINGDTTSAIWWTKARMGWSEKRENIQDVKVSDISEDAIDSRIDQRLDDLLEELRSAGEDAGNITA